MTPIDGKQNDNEDKSVLSATESAQLNRTSTLQGLLTERTACLLLRWSNCLGDRRLHRHQRVS